MELNKPIKSKIIIICIMILLIFGVISLFTNRLLIKENVKGIMNNQELDKLIKEDKDLNDLLLENKIPVEVLDNITNSELELLSSKAIDNLYDNKEELINYKVINDIIKKSINTYEKEKNVDIYNNISKNIESISKNMASNINDIDFVYSYNFVNSISCVFYVNFIIMIILLVILIIYEKKNGLLFGGLSIGFSSLSSYYLISNMVYSILGNIKILDITNKYLIKRISAISETICGIILAVGIILVIVYVILSLKNVLRDFRMKYVYKYE